jgi:hypothetical protein
MIRLTGRFSDGAHFLLLGVDAENIKRLTDGKPILCKAESMAGGGLALSHDVIVVYGKTLDEITQQLGDAGVRLPQDQRPPAPEHGPGLDGRTSFALWWAMVNAEAELAGEPIADSTVILNFMGSGASHTVTAKEIRELLADGT